MTALILATALALSAAPTPPSADTTRVPRFTASTRALLIPADTRAARDTSVAIRHFDKVQHFAMSYAVASFTYAISRAAGADGDIALYSSAGAVSVAGVGKELYDRRRASSFSVADLVADALGGIAAYAVLRQIR